MAPIASARPGGLLIACMFLASAGCSSDHTATASPEEGAPPAIKPRDVRVTPATELKVLRTVSVTGTLNAEEQVVLSMKVTGASPTWPWISARASIAATWWPG